LSPSDLKEIKEPLWLQPNKGVPTLMLFSVVDDRSAIADYLAIPLAKLPPEQLEWINTLVETTLSKKEVIEQVEEYFGRRTERESPC
jgi:hypothetical protein